MNKTTKASIATAAGIVLLLGGAGSLAYWTDTANTGAAAQTIAAGTLTVEAVDAGQWTKGFYDAADAVVTAPANVAIGDVKLVPGNKLVYTQTFDVVATGQDLYFTVTSTDGALGTTTNGLAGRLVDTFDVGAVTGTTIVPSTTAGVYKVDPADGEGTATITVTWTVNWPFGDGTSVTADNAAKLGTVALTQGAVTLTQVATP